MVTTIQLNENVKFQLERLKYANQTYEDVIVQLIKATEFEKRKQEELLIEGCKEMAKDSLKICKEWETTDGDFDWEWK
jgi:predicted CopG family antitoxin